LLIEKDYMKILVIGGGGREHALCWKLKQSPLVSELFCSPGNAGIAQIAECIDGDPVDVARRVQADFVVVGPEVPLSNGVVDELAAAGIPAFGPGRAAAQMEASKIFCKEILQKYHIPTAQSNSFDNIAGARAFLESAADAPIVVKMDGLAAGKGVVVASGKKEALEALAQFEKQGHSEVPILIEECLPGDEVSLIALTDGETIVPLVPAQDHKRIGEGDTGPNTGGMGCYSPVPVFTDEIYQEAVEKILQPTIEGLRNEGIIYRGALYAGLMLTPEGPKVLEYNCRFGDPETQVILPRLESDLLPLLMACADKSTFPGMPDLKEVPCEWTEQAAMCVILSAGGYPSDYRKNDVITGLEAAAQDGAVVFHAGTRSQDHQILTSGGRVLGVTALGDGFLQARERCYRAVEKIHFEGAYFRRDIGWRCL
jgi:phosphoribosylamine--glycine ligase